MFVQNSNHPTKKIILKGKYHPGWKGGRVFHTNGYVLIYKPNHPRANNKGYVPEQILIAEKVIKKFLPLTAIVHHIDDKKINNNPTNLIICQDRSYHTLIHRRQIAMKECGDPHKRKCNICHKYDNPENMHKTNSQGHQHRSCRQKYKKTHLKKKEND